MKKILVSFFLTAFLPLMTVANPITIRQAEGVARQVFKAQGKDIGCLDQVDVSDRVKARVPSAKPAAMPAYYVFTTGEDAFVIISGDDDFPAVVGYSDHASLADDGTIPEQLASFLDSYTCYVEDVRAGIAQAPARAKGDITGDEVIAPMVGARWDQDSPFNYYVPNNCPAGCVAIAMAQIMYYYQYPSVGKGQISYDSGQGTLSANLNESVYDWSIMKATYSKLDASKKTGKNVARLCYDCGVSVYMSYSAGGSGSTIENAYNALFTNFGYNAESMRYWIRECTDTQEEWNRILFGELDSHRPVLYAGRSPSGGGSDSGGHAFVIDGYDSNYFVHVNWGWGGTYNGYYDLTVLDGGNYKFNSGQKMIVGIMPDPDGLHTERKQFPMYLRDPLEAPSGDYSISNYFNLKVHGIFNHSPYALQFRLAVGMYDLQGNLVKIISQTSDDYLVSIPSSYGYNDFGDIKCVIRSAPADGFYILRLITMESGFDDYVLPYTVGGHVNNRVFAKVQNGRVYFGQVPTAIDEVDADPEVIATDYFDLCGRAISDVNAAHGIVIKVKTLSNGQKRSEKILK